MFITYYIWDRHVDSHDLCQKKRLKLIINPNL